MFGKILVDCCLMSGLWSRRCLPLALMKLADRVPICLSRLEAHVSKRVFPVAVTTVLPSFRVALANSVNLLRRLLSDVDLRQPLIGQWPGHDNFPSERGRPKRSAPTTR